MLLSHRVEMGGALGTVKDKIFAAYSNPNRSNGAGSGQNLFASGMDQIG